MDRVTIMRGTDPFWDINLEADSQQSKTIMGDNILTIHFFNSNVINFHIQDYCTVFGEIYTLNELPVIKKTATNHFEYTLKMQAEGFNLSKAQYLFLGTDNTLMESDFYLMGNAETFIDLVIANINRISSGWVKGEVIPTDYKNLGFKNENCYNALARLAQEFGTEFWIVGKTIHLAKKSNDTGFTYTVGYNKGLKEITRVNIDSTRVITRLYPYGSEKNLPTDYLPIGSRRLHLPPLVGSGNDCFVSDITWQVSQVARGTTILTNIKIIWNPPLNPAVTSLILFWGPAGSGTFPNSQPLALGRIAILTNMVLPVEFKFRILGGVCDLQETAVFTVTGSNFVPQYPLSDRIYIENNVDLYGIIEETVFFDDIYPHRTGTVTSIDATDPFKVIDAAIDFDLNTAEVPGLTEQITFMTGQLAGYTFDISTYDNGTKTIVILKNKNETLLDVPSALFKPQIGDQYVITNIHLPTSYVQAAEAELLAAGEKYLQTYSQPQYTIQALTDTKFMKNYNRALFIGDTIWIKDDQLEIDRKIRISQVIRNLIEEFQFQITLADIIAVGTIDSMNQNIASNGRDSSQVGAFVQSRDVINGSMILSPNPGGAGFEPVIVETATNKLYRQE